MKRYPAIVEEGTVDIYPPETGRYRRLKVDVGTAFFITPGATNEATIGATTTVTTGSWNN
jgi:hypothetical protein